MVEMLVAKNWVEVVKTHTLKVNNTRQLARYYDESVPGITVVGLHDERYISYVNRDVAIPFTRSLLYDILLTGTVALVFIISEADFNNEARYNQLRDDIQKSKTIGLMTLDVVKVNGTQTESVQIQ